MKGKDFFNDTHMEEFVLCWIQYKIHWNTRLAASDVFHMFTQGGLNKKEIQINLCNTFSIFIFNELYLFT